MSNNNFDRFQSRKSCCLATTIGYIFMPYFLNSITAVNQFTKTTKKVLCRQIGTYGVDKIHG